MRRARARSAETRLGRLRKVARVHDVRPSHDRCQRGCDRVRRVAAEVAHGAQNVDPQPVVLLDTRLPPERDELAAHAVDQGQGARQLSG